MRKFIFSGAMLSSLLSGWSTAQATRKGPRDWRLGIRWAIWGLTLALAIGTVLRAQEANELED